MAVFDRSGDGRERVERVAIQEMPARTLRPDVPSRVVPGNGGRCARLEVPRRCVGPLA